MKKRYVYTVERWGKVDMTLFASAKMNLAKDQRDRFRDRAANPEEFQLLRWVDGERVCTLVE